MTMWSIIVLIVIAIGLALFARGYFTEEHSTFYYDGEYANQVYMCSECGQYVRTLYVRTPLNDNDCDQWLTVGHALDCKIWETLAKDKRFAE